MKPLCTIKILPVLSEFSLWLGTMAIPGTPEADTTKPLEHYKDGVSMHSQNRLSIIASPPGWRFGQGHLPHNRQHP
jgi:hypothetical protein